MNDNTDCRIPSNAILKTAARCFWAALIAVAVAALIFLWGLHLGGRTQDGVSNAEIHTRIETEAADLRTRLTTVDAKLDILLNIATNAVNRDLSR